MGHVYIADDYGNVYAFKDVVRIGGIRGGIASVRAEIENIDDEDMDDVNWSISVTGGILSMINRTKNGTIEALEANTTETVRLLLILGIGKVNVTMTATFGDFGTRIMKTASGFVLGPLVIIR